MVTKTKVIAIDGKGKSSELELPIVFETPYRPEIIHKAYINLLSHSYQKQGRYPAAGEMVSAESRNTGLGIARLARARGEGFPRAGQAAEVAGVRHGRVAHPPESWKIIYKKINKKESRIALCSAIAATSRKDLVEGRGHALGKITDLPIVVSNDIESITKTKDLKAALTAIGIEQDLIRASSPRKARTGTARRRGRPARSGTSALVVVKEGANVLALSDSLLGINVKDVKSLSVLDFAPGSKPIRLTVFSENAISDLKELKAPFNRVMELIRAK